MGNFDSIKKHQSELIRKALSGSVFIAEATAAGIEDLTEATGTAPDQVIGLAALPVDYRDLGLLSDDGVSHSSETTSSDVTSWQNVSPSRSDITSEITTISLLAQETSLVTLGLYSGSAFSSLVVDATTGELSIPKAARPSSKFYRLLTLAVDENEFGEIYLARYFPRAKITGKAEQAFAKGDTPIGWGLTFQGYEDSTVGYSERLIFGGPGWLGLKTKMGWV